MPSWLGYWLGVIYQRIPFASFLPAPVMPMRPKHFPRAAITDCTSSHCQDNRGHPSTVTWHTMEASCSSANNRIRETSQHLEVEVINLDHFYRHFFTLHGVHLWLPGKFWRTWCWGVSLGLFEFLPLLSRWGRKGLAPPITLHPPCLLHTQMKTGTLQL